MPPKKKNKPAKKVVTLAEDATEVLAKVRELRKKTAAIIEKEAKKEESADDYGDFDPR
jgi:DNA-binding PadR family transcriptional regulator